MVERELFRRDHEEIKKIIEESIERELKKLEKSLMDELKRLEEQRRVLPKEEGCKIPRRKDKSLKAPLKVNPFFNALYPLLALDNSQSKNYNQNGVSNG